MQELRKYLLLTLLILLAIPLLAQNQDLLKNFLTVENGLSHNEVTSIVQDHDGFIWIGTRGGLNRYDGYEFKTFNQIPGDSNSLVNPSIESLFVDSKGNIWIGTKSGGVSKYNPQAGVFTNIISNYKTQNSIIPSNRLLSFYEDRNGKIWMGTWRNGLVVYDEESKTSQTFLSGTVNSIVESSDGKIWVGTRTGLYEFNPSDYSSIQHKNVIQCQEIVYDNKRNALWIVGGNNGLRKFDLRNNKLSVYRIGGSLSDSSNQFHQMESVFIDNEDRIWVGTWGTGFYLFHPQTEIFTRYSIYPENRLSLNKDYDTVLDIFQDRDNGIWLGTNGGGVCVLTEKLKFNSISYHFEKEKGLTNTRIMSVVDDDSGNLWLGTIGSGLFWSPDRENFYPVENEHINASGFFTIKFLYEDENGRIWCGTNRGTFFVEFKNGKPHMVRAGVVYPNGIFFRQAVSFLEHDGMFWFGTLQGGLFLLDKHNQYKRLKHLNTGSKANDAKSERMSFLLKDATERVWIGTYNGLHVYNKKDTTLRIAENYFNISGEFTGNIITCLAQDQKGNIWVGTPNGLNKLSETAAGEFKVQIFTEKEGLASNFVKGISYDLNDNIWISTNVGISKLVTKEQNRVVNFDEQDGVSGKNFTEASVYRNNKGEIFFGGSYGLTYFSPDEIKENPDSHKPILTGLSVLNKPVEIGREYDSDVILSKTISRTDEIELSYRQNKLEIQFSALDFNSKGKNRYQFLLENHDDEWSDIGTRRFAIFNNLKPGEYVFRVKSSNRHGVWNDEEAKLRIVVNPPFWQTLYALLFYILVVVGIVTIIRRNAVKQVRLANNLEMERLQHDQDQKLNEMKFRFFTNLSHEFRTPLTLILAPLRELIKNKEQFELTNEAENKIGIAQKNSFRLMKLINQLLDFRKAESGDMKLFASKTNIEEFVEEVSHPFSELAKINNIRFKIRAGLKTSSIWVDRDKLETILNNLISNAFKYVRENDKIEVALYEEEDVILLCVSDTGPGIPQTELDNIFDRFYRVGKLNGSGGSGIGLALTKRFVEMHKGSISVNSVPNENTEFIVSLPKGNKHLKPHEIVEPEKQEVSLTRGEQIFSGVLSDKSNSQQTKLDYNILIVEDNRDVNDYLVSLLEPLYNVKSAFNGADGFDIAVENVPHLILSDVMMPEMDGFEFCEKIRTKETTATIPFIFLTAKSDEQFKLLGTQLGADDFLSKPFDPNLLLEKVKNILESRKKLQKQYSKSVHLGPSEIEITSGEEIFIEKVILTIEENLQNQMFSSDVLASEMNMSNSSLYRKLKGLTGCSTAEFVRSIRIKRAAQLLADKQRTITEIAYEVGFNDVKHFRTVFQKQFACTPSEYRTKL